MGQCVILRFGVSSITFLHCNFILHVNLFFVSFPSIISKILSMWKSHTKFIIIKSNLKQLRLINYLTFQHSQNQFYRELKNKRSIEY